MGVKGETDGGGYRPERRWVREGGLERVRGEERVRRGLFVEKGEVEVGDARGERERERGWGHRGKA